MQNFRCLDFSPQKPDSLIEMRSKSEFSPLLPLHPLKPGRTDSPGYNFEKAISYQLQGPIAV